MGEEAYELDLSVERKVHNVFHVSSLVKVLGHHSALSTVLLPLDDEGKLVLGIEVVIDFKERKLRQQTISECLVKWKDLPVEDVT